MDPSNLALLQGTLSSDPVKREIASGTRLVSLNLTNTHADGARSVPLVWFDPSPSVLTRLHSGVAVIVAGATEGPAPHAGSIEVGGGVTFVPGFDMGSATADLTTSSPTTRFDLFTTDSRVGDFIGVSARVGYYISRSI